MTSHDFQVVKQTKKQTKKSFYGVRGFLLDVTDNLIGLFLQTLKPTHLSHTRALIRLETYALCVRLSENTQGLVLIIARHMLKLSFKAVKCHFFLIIPKVAL